MIKKIKKRIFNSRFVSNLLTDPIDLSLFRRKPTPRFMLGLAIVGFSYLIAWPLISLLGILAVLFKRPLLFAVGSPIAYVTSHLVFLLGVFIAGKDTVTYMNVFLRWSLRQGAQKIFADEKVKETEILNYREEVNDNKKH